MSTNKSGELKYFNKDELLVSIRHAILVLLIATFFAILGSRVDLIVIITLVPPFLAAALSIILYEFRSLKIVEKHLEQDEKILYVMRLSSLTPALTAIIGTLIPLTILLAVFTFSEKNNVTPVSTYIICFIALVYIYYLFYALIPIWRAQSMLTNKRILIMNSKVQSIFYKDINDLTELRRGGAMRDKGILVKYGKNCKKILSKAEYRHYEELKETFSQIYKEFKNQQQS